MVISQRQLIGILASTGAGGGFAQALTGDEVASRGEQIGFGAVAGVGAGLIGISMVKPGTTGAMLTAPIAGLALGMGLGVLADERFRGQWL